MAYGDLSRGAFIDGSKRGHFHLAAGVRDVTVSVACRGLVMPGATA